MTKSITKVRSHPRKVRGADGYVWTLGNCYQDAVDCLLTRHHNSGRKWAATLCHGIVTGDGGIVRGLEYVHAWLEYRKGGRTVCLTLGREHPRDAYYRGGKVHSVQRYSLMRVCRLILDTDHYGPWCPKLVQCQKAIEAAVAARRKLQEEVVERYIAALSNAG